jgi:hypothetical protein
VGEDVSLWAIKTVTGDVFTRGGAILVHDDRAELEFLFPGRTCTDVTNTALPTTRWSEHPDMAGISWPLRREEFR